MQRFVGLGRLAARSRKDLVELVERVLVEFNCRGSHGALELLNRARANDWRRDDRVVQQPRKRNLAWRMADVATQALVLLELLTLVLDLLREFIAGAAPGIVFLERPAQQAAAERAPGNQS